MALLDNNPAGHNTVIVREAFQSSANGANETEINFSQFNFVSGEMRVANVSRDGGDGGGDGERHGGSETEGACVLLDGAAVYGAGRPDGWLDVMSRYACPISSGTPAFVVVDLLKVKEGRVALHLDGDGRGGPIYAEGEARTALRLDEYFFTETAAVLAQDANGNRMAEELPFNSANHSRNSRCAHVDLYPIGEFAAPQAVLLHPRCGIGEERVGDGLAVVGGFAAQAGGGYFIVDGLVTAPNRWLVPHSYSKRRFRFVTAAPTDATGGDVRAFVLVPAAAQNRSAPPVVRLSSCSDAIGCGSLSTPLSCSCVELCIGSTLRWAVVRNASLTTLHVVGTCDVPVPTVVIVVVPTSIDAAVHDGVLQGEVFHVDAGMKPFIIASFYHLMGCVGTFHSGKKNGYLFTPTLWASLSVKNEFS